MNEEDVFKENRNPDPITGEPGFHPIGTVAGGASGAMTGAAIGTIGGPVGVILGAAAGGLVGGLAGDVLAELLNPSDIDEYWRAEFEKGAGISAQSYEEVKNELYFGTQGRLRYGKSAPPWNEVEPDLAKLWRASPLWTGEEWQQVRATVFEAFRVADAAIKRVLEQEADGQREEL
jgi:hypothetical protein